MSEARIPLKIWRQQSPDQLFAAPGTVNSGWPRSVSSQATRGAQLSSALASSRANVDLPAPLLPHTATTAGRAARARRHHLAADAGRRLRWHRMLLSSRCPPCSLTRQAMQGMHSRVVLLLLLQRMIRHACMLRMVRHACMLCKIRVM